MSVKNSLGQRRGVERVASWPRRQLRQARSAQCVLCGRSAGSPRDKARARHAPREKKDTATTVRSRIRRTGAVSVKKSFGQRHGVERVASWPHRQPREVRSAQCVLRGRSAGSPRDEARTRRAPRDYKETATTVLSRSRRPGAVSATGASANGVGWSPSRVGRADNRAKSAARSACSVGGRLVLHGATRTRAARHGTRKRRLRRFEAASDDLVPCRQNRASANGVGWSASRVGQHNN